MLFNSWNYAVFLPIVFIVYWMIPHRFRWILLLISSYYFYMSWEPKYIVLILGTTLVSYISAIFLEKAGTNTKKKLCLSFCIICSLGVLFIFKYFNFVSINLSRFINIFSLDVEPIVLDVLLPVGISFYTFQTMSYVIDVYRGKVRAEKHFGYYATFVSYFPQLVAGPIERTDKLLPQIREEKVFNCEQASEGIRLMLWGFYKKIVVADTVAICVDKIYGDVYNNNGFSLLAASLLFTIQIYCDFSGYSDIAIGTSKLLGVNLMTNFKTPYFSSSIKEFWKRWHISLSSWFKDYVYIPLGGNRCSRIRHYFNLMITFLLSGIWHGANWTFIIWGGLHGAAQIVENLFSKPLENMKRTKFGKLVCITGTFLFCNFAWIFFRVDSMSEAVYIILGMFSGISELQTYFRKGLDSMGLTLQGVMYLGGILGILFVVDEYQDKTDIKMVFNKKKRFFRWIGYMIIALMVVFFSQKGVAAEFVYFQF